MLARLTAQQMCMASLHSQDGGGRFENVPRCLRMGKALVEDRLSIVCFVIAIADDKQPVDLLAEVRLPAIRRVAQLGCRSAHWLSEAHADRWTWRVEAVSEAGGEGETKDLQPPRAKQQRAEDFLHRVWVLETLSLRRLLGT